MAKYNMEDKINFLEFEYKLIKNRKGFYWNNFQHKNDKVFYLIDIDKRKFFTEILGYCNSGIFPEMETLEDVEKLTDALLLECAKFRYPVGTFYISTAGNKYKAEKPPYFYDSVSIAVTQGGGLIYDINTNKWAKVEKESDIKSKFEVGKWYKGEVDNYYIKFSDITKEKKYNKIWYTEKISNGKHIIAKDYWSNNEFEEFALENPVSLEEIQKYLPAGHPDLIKEEFVLPEKWHVVVTKDNQEILSDWRGTNVPIGYIVGIDYFNGNKYSRGHSPKNQIKGNSFDFGVEITFDQFKKYVLKDDIKEPSEEEFKVGDILYLSDNRGKAAPKGSIAECVASFNGEYIKVKWINDGGVGQCDGEYSPGIFRKTRPEEIPLQAIGITPHYCGIDPVSEPKTTLSIDDDELPMARPREEIKVTKQLSIE